MNEQDYQKALAEIAQQDAEIQEGFDAETEAYLHIDERDTPAREEQAARLDTQNAEFPSLASDSQFEFAEPNWNDHLDDTQMYHYCDRICDALRRQGVEQRPPRDTLHSREALLNCSFSERIKVHIVELVAGKETIEGACRHCFGLYGEDSHNRTLGNSMAIWHTLCSLLGDAPVYHAFLERAWHLNPTSPYFPNQYRDLVQTIRASHLDKTDRPTYANPYRQMELLDETLKKLAYTIKHTTNPGELAKLANAQVRVAGALHVINAKLDDEHQHAIETAKQKALTG